MDERMDSSEECGSTIKTFQYATRWLILSLLPYYQAFNFFEKLVDEKLEQHPWTNKNGPA